MSDDILRSGLTLAGAYFFGPWGAIIGGFLGNVLFPAPGAKGPRLSELNVQHSTIGAPVPIVYGTYVLAGNVIWSGGLIETEHEGGGGKKGGAGAPTSYTYSVDVAIGICEGPISGIRRIWADADLIYDASSDADLEARLALEGADNIADLFNAIRAMSAQLDFTLYTGTDDQLPDPTIESYEVAGTTPAYRGLAYITLQNFVLTKFGNRIPNFRFEVYSGTPTECGIYSPGTLYPWLYAERDPRDPRNSYEYAGTDSSYSDFSLTMAQATAQLGASYNPDIIHAWSHSTTPNDTAPCNGTTTDYVKVYLEVNVQNQAGPYVCEIANSCGHPAQSVGSCFWNEIGPEVLVRWDGQITGAAVDAGPGFFYMTPGRASSGAAGADACIEGTSGSVEFVESGGVYVRFCKARDQEVAVRRTLLPPDPCSFGEPIVGAPGWCVVNGQIVQGITWTEVSGTFHVLQKYADSGSVVTSYPVGPALISTDSNYNDQDYWESAYAAAVTAGDIAPGLTYGVDYPETQSFAYFSECETVDAVCVPMGLIVADICRRAGLRTDTSSQIDVSDLTTCVIGYAIGSQMSARDALQPLRQFGLWDAVESGEVLRFVERAHAIVEELSTDHLGAHEYDSQPPSAIETSRLQEKDLPRRVRVHFPNYLHDHESSEQAASRLATEAVNELDVNLPVVMEPDTAAQLAEILLYAEYVGRNTYRLALDNDFLHLEPTDCIEVPVDGQTERMRIVSVNYKIGGILEIDAQRDDDGSYQSTAVAKPAQGSGAAPGTGGSNLICPTETVLLDIPRIRDIDIDAGYYAAMYSSCGAQGWTCAELYRSDDGGLTYGRVARTDLQATVGVIDELSGPATDPTLPGDSPPYDAFNTITVTLFNGELETITDAQIDAGQNLAAVGIDGRWVLIQYKTVTLSTVGTYVLSDLIWGLNDTQHLLGSTIAGDTFVLLSDSALLRIPENPDAIGVEKTFKDPTCGEALDAVTSFTFTTWGLSYQRLCPSTVISCSTMGPPTSAADGDSYFLPPDTSLTGVWATHGGQVATWSDETDSWVYCTPAAGTILHCSDEDVDVIPPGGGGTPTPAPWQRAIEWQDEGVPVADRGAIDTINISGPGAIATVDTSGVLQIVVSGGGTSDTGGGPDVTAEPFVTYTASAGLSAERVLTAGSNISLDTSVGGLITINGTLGAGIPLNTQTGNYTLVLGDAGYCIYRDGSNGTNTWTIPANSSVAFPIGTVLMFDNSDSAANTTIAITTDTAVYTPGGAGGARVLVPGGRAFYHKRTSTSWKVSGTGVY